MKHFLYNFIEVQLVITLISLPILINWGLPISLMSFAANLIFSPALMLFIIVSAALFFTELLYIPNGLIAQLLNLLALAWHKVLSYGSKQWLYYAAHPGNLILASIFITTVIILYFRPNHSPLKRIGLLTAYLIATWSGLALVAYVQSHTPIILPGEKLIIESHDGKVVIIDNGYFNTKKSPEKSVEFELKPFLAKEYGTTTIDQITINKPGLRSFEGAHACCKYLSVNIVKLPYFEGDKFSKNCWRHYFNFKRIAQEEDVIVLRS